MCVCTYQQTQITGDTIVNNKFLQKVDSSKSEIFDSLCLKPWIYIHTDSNKVFAGTDPNSLNLLYDFTLNVGDSFTFNAVTNTPFPNTYALAVDSVDTLILGGVPRKRIKFTRIPFYQMYQDPIQWVQGIGDLTYGFVLDYGFIVYANYVNTGNCALSCFTDSISSVFGNCTYGSCALDLIETQIPNYSIFPIPANNELFINHPFDLRNMTVQLYNSLGEKILDKIFAGVSASISLDVSKINNGIYFVSLTQGEQIKTYKIVIKH
ncbi:MAG: T9SS type A sorting domain-containing protein [Bacteroidetes bacterium]|nr:T9SS type A sorting domain-containing protein [Bacteroidota bacterium]